jgi:hypothetical protein
VTLAGILAACALVLFAVDRYVPMPAMRTPSVESAIATDIDALLQRENIRREWMKTRQVRTPEKRFIRLERRIAVPADFLSLKFNLELSRLLSKYGARVVATEHTRESYVTMHVIVTGMVVQSLAFLEDPELKWQKP